MAIHECLQMQGEFHQSEGWDKRVKVLGVTLKNSISVEEMSYISRCKGFCFNFYNTRSKRHLLIILLTPQALHDTLAKLRAIITFP